MHILLIHQSFAALDEPGGTRHHELALRLLERGHRVTVIASPVSYLTGGETAARKVEHPTPGITIHRAYTYTALHRSFVHRVFSFLSFMLSSFWVGLRVREVDLVWGTSPPIFQGVTAWALACLKGARFLFEVRDLWPAFAVQVGVLRNPLLIQASEWLERFLYRRADRVMVNSPGFIEHVRERSGREPALIPNGADTEMFDPGADGQALRGEWGVGDRFVVLYAGAHGISNDLGVALQAAQILQEEGDTNAVFAFLGAGKEKEALVAQAEEMRLGNVLFLPPVPKTQMPQALAAADACLAILKPIPLYATVYPNKVFDYLAAGKPVVLVIDGVIRKVVEDAGAGLYSPPGDPRLLAEAVRALAADPDAARQMGLRGRLYVEQHFDRAALARELGELMEGMVGD